MQLAETMSPEERRCLRELARKYRDYALLPIMEQRKQLWYDHNALRGQRPPVVMEIGGFLAELLPSRRCASPVATKIETNLLAAIVNHELIDDDKVISPEYVLPLRLGLREFDLDISQHRAVDATGRKLGYADEHPITDLERDLPKLRHSTFWVDRDGTVAEQRAIEEAIGDILPVQIENHFLRWHLGLSSKIVRLMGMELMLVEMADRPELIQALYRFLVDDIHACLNWQEREGLLTLNNSNNYAGAGSYGFTRELPRPASVPGKVLSTGDLWGNLNSQETVGISPSMYVELIYPAYEELASRFGMVYYGCCEPVHDLWERCLCRLPNLRKVSVSAWCDESRIGEMLRGGRVIYSRKPSPNFVGVGSFDEAAFAAHITRTLTAARGCSLEIIFRDIYTLCGDVSKAGRAVRMVRDLVDRVWA